MSPPHPTQTKVSGEAEKRLTKPPLLVIDDVVVVIVVANTIDDNDKNFSPSYSYSCFF